MPARKTETEPKVVKLILIDHNEEEVYYFDSLEDAEQEMDTWEAHDIEKLSNKDLQLNGEFIAIFDNGRIRHVNVERSGVKVTL